MTTVPSEARALTQTLSRRRERAAPVILSEAKNLAGGGSVHCPLSTLHYPLA